MTRRQSLPAAAAALTASAANPARCARGAATALCARGASAVSALALFTRGASALLVSARRIGWPAFLALVPLVAISAVSVSGISACAASAGSGGMTGTGGSLARFVVQGEHLYALDNSSLTVFDLQEGLHPVRMESHFVGSGLETLFISGTRLFMGARTGMYIYDISVPEAPRKLAFTGHLYSCDPVVVRGNTAFVTLRKGSLCRGGSNELRVYDVSDPSAPRQIASYPMHNPWGLGVDGPWLFVADGKAGLKVYDSRDPTRLRLIGRHRKISGYDVIPNGGVLIISAADGLYQYDYKQGRLRLLSRLAIGKDAMPLPALRVVVPPPAPAVEPPPKKRRPARAMDLVY